MAKLVTSDGKVSDVSPLNGKQFTRKELQQYVGGFIEIIACNSPRFVVVTNEYGVPLGLPVNRAATSMVSKTGLLKDGKIAGDVLVGTAEEVGMGFGRGI